jgi:hypothetical protein
VTKERLQAENHKIRWENEQFRSAVAARLVIERAKGVLIERLDLSADDVSEFAGAVGTTLAAQRPRACGRDPQNASDTGLHRPQPPAPPPNDCWFPKPPGSRKSRAWARLRPGYPAFSLARGLFRQREAGGRFSTPFCRLLDHRPAPERRGDGRAGTRRAQSC